MSTATRRHGARTVALASVVGALACLTMLGCGGGEAAVDSLSPEAAVAEAATKTTDAGSAKMSFSADVRPEGPGAKPFSMTGEGVFDYETRSGRMTFDMSELLAAAGQSAADAELEVVFEGLVMYMRFPLLSQSIPGAKEWIRMDLEELSKQQGFDLGQLSQLNQSDPTQALQYLRAASEDGVETVGEEEVRGVQTTHYRLTVDLRKVAETAPQDQRAAVRKSIERIIELSGQTTIPTEVWLDDEGRVRRQSYEQKLPAQGDTGGGTMKVVMEMYDFGTEVDVELPPSDRVTDLAELIEQGSA